MTNLGNISNYLGIEIDYILGNKITLYQNIYLKKLLDYFDITDYKSTSLLINLGIANSLQSFNGTTDLKIIKLYASAIESLM